MLHVHVYPVMMFFNKGSLFQVVLCMALALGFLCTSAWYQPYASRSANLFKIGTEAALVRMRAMSQPTGYQALWCIALRRVDMTNHISVRA